MNSEDRLNRAEQAVAEGNYRAAIIDARNVLQEEPDNVRGRLLLGRAALALADGATAEKEFRRAVELGTEWQSVVVEFGRALLLQSKYESIVGEILAEDASTEDERAEIYKLRGDAYLGLRDLDAARRAYTESIRLDGNLLDAQLGIVRSYQAEQNYAQARVNLDHILTENPDYAAGWLASGDLYLSLRSLDSAQLSYRRAIELAATQSVAEVEVRGLAGLSETFLAGEQVDEARGLISRLTELAPNSIVTRMLAARIAFLDQEWERAQQILQGVLQVSPDSRPAQMLLGAVHLRSGQLAQAEMYLSAVVADNPRNAEARKLLAEARLQLDRLDEARLALRPLLTREETDVRALQLATQASLGEGRNEEAIGYLERLIDAEPANTDLIFSVASTYVNLGEVDKAEDLLLSINVQDSEQDTLRRDVLLIMTEIRRGNLDAASAATIALVEKNPDSAIAYNLLGAVEVARGNYDAARAHFSSSEELSSRPLLHLRNLASADEGEGEYSAAESRYEQILEIEPKATWAMVALARLAQLREDSEKARAWLEKARQTDSRAVSPRQILARYFIAMGDFEAAAEVSREIIEATRSNAEAYNILGTALLNSGQPREAASALEEAVRLDPEESLYRVSLAMALDRLGQPEVALEKLDYDTGPRGAGVMPDISTSVMAATLKAKAGDIAEGLRIARDLVDSYPDQAIAHALLGELHVEAGEFADAARAYDAVLDLLPSKRFSARAYGLRSRAGRPDRLQPLTDYLAERPLDTEIRLLLAGAYADSGNIDQAIEQYERVLSLDSNNGIALNNLAMIFLENGDPRAEQWARKALVALPGNSSVMDTLGWVLVQKGSPEEGIELLRRAIQDGGDRPAVMYHLAVGLTKVGKPDEARRLLEEALSSDSDFSEREAAEELLLAI